MIVDLVMWTFNGEKTLGVVLKQIGAVIPKECINQKIIVDDNSSDSTVKIALSHGWQVHPNKGKGISDGANTALNLVASDYFCSFEQDVVLSNDWWVEVQELIKENDVACGIRLPDKPEALRKIEEYAHEKYRKNGLYCTTIDNTIYKTEVVRKVGGYPNINSNVGVDSALAQKIKDYGFCWITTFDLVSVHLRNGLKGELHHNFWYGKEAGNLSDDGKRLLFSPIRALIIAWKKHSVDVLFLYPLLKLAKFIGVLMK